MKLKVLILNDRDKDSGFGGQASFIKNLHPFLEKEYDLTYLTLSAVYHQQKIIPIRLLYLFRVICFMIRKRENFDLIISHTPEASFAASLFTVPFVHIFHGNANPLSMSKFRIGKYFRGVFDRFETRIKRKAGLLYTVGEPGKNAIKIYNPIAYIPERILPYGERRDFIFSGRLENVKNVDMIIKRYDTLPDQIKQN
ncbi:MAG: glycosyltransferase family 4 protein, partial [Bacteroidales bacterium]|nr:glycosyltransferase family 4 protein [Bacteroidales bacterium]